MAAEKPEVPFMCAGARFTGKDSKINGSFHPISTELWNCIVGFHRAASIKHDGESVSYHRWHAASQSYHTIIPWQRTQEHGLHVDVNWQHADNKALLDEYAKRFGEDFFPACTVHTHVDASGFESGTDANDEKDNPGWHITLGHLISYPKYNLHFRMRAPRRKALSDVINTAQSIELRWQHLFAVSPEMEEFVHTTPGTTDWSAFLERISDT